MQHRMNRHLEHQHAMSHGGLQASESHQMAAVLCGTRADLADDAGKPAVSMDDLHFFVHKNCMQGMVYTSAVTGEGVDEAIQTLLAAVLDLEEDAEADRVVAEALPPTLAHASADMAGTAHRLVEVLQGGSSFSARSLAHCLAHGLCHRVVHVWLHDAKAGCLLLRRYHADSPKHPDCWAPTCHGEVLCQPSSQYGAAQAHHGVPELLLDAAKRIMREQFVEASTDLDVVPFEQWFTCQSADKDCVESIVVYVVPTIGTHGQTAGSKLLSSMKLKPGEAA
eukprot:3825396-Amphidinium_carterae.1